MVLDVVVPLVVAKAPPSAIGGVGAHVSICSPGVCFLHVSSVGTVVLAVGPMPHSDVIIRAMNS